MQNEKGEEFIINDGIQQKVSNKPNNKYINGYCKYCG
jgi:hypothetical protein